MQQQWHQAPCCCISATVGRPTWCRDKLESGGSRASTPEASTPASLLSTPSGVRSPRSDVSSQGAPSPLRHTLQLAAGRLEALRSGDTTCSRAGVAAASGARRAVLLTPPPSAANLPTAAAAVVGPSSPRTPAAAASVAATPASAAHLLALGDHAELVGAEADTLRDGLRGARRQLSALHRQLLAMQRHAARQQLLLGTVLLEQECEVKLVRSEAEAYRTAGRVRTAAVTTLQSTVAALQEERGRLQAQVHQLTASLAEADRRESSLQELGALLQGRVVAVEEAQATAQAAAELASQLEANVSGLQGQLAAAQEREAALAVGKEWLEEQVAVAAAASAQLQARVEELQTKTARQEAAAVALRQQVVAAGVEPAQLAAQLRLELEEQRSANATLLQQQVQLQARTQAAEAEAGTAVGELAAACEQNAMLAEQLMQLQEQVEELSAGRAELAAALHRVGGEKAALEGRLAQAEGDAASLRRMLRMLKYGDSAAPSPVAGAAADVAAGAAAAVGSAARRPRAAVKGCSWAKEAAQCSDSGSSEESEKGGAALAPAREEASGYGSGSSSVSPPPPQRAGSSSKRQAAQFLEEQVQSLTAALRRLQRHNRELSAQLAAASASDGTLVSTAVPQAAIVVPAAFAALRHDARGLEAENAALRRQLEAAEGEARHAQWQMQRQQAEARTLHGQVLEVMAALNEAGLAPPPQLDTTAAAGEPPAAALPAHAALAGLPLAAPLAGALANQQQPASQRQPPAGGEVLPQGDARVLADLRQAMAALDGEQMPEQGSEDEDEQLLLPVDSPAGRPAVTATAAAALAVVAIDGSSDGGSDVSDVFDASGIMELGHPASFPPSLASMVGTAAGAGPSPAAAHHLPVIRTVAGSSPLLHQVACDIAALNSRSAAPQQEIDGISVASNSLVPRRPPPQQRSNSAAGWGRATAALPECKPAAVASHTLLPPTPDLSQS